MRASAWLLAGAVAPQLSSFPSDFDQFLASIVALGIVLVALLPRLRRSDILLFLLGLILFHAAARHIISDRLDPAFAGDSILTELRISDFPKNDDNASGFLAQPLDDPRVPPRVMLNWQEPPVALRLGDVWRLEVRLRRPRSTSNPGSMDYESWLFRQHIGATGYVVGGSRNVLVDSNTATGVDAVRLAFIARAQRALGNDEALPVLLAIGIGARHLVSAEAWQRYARTGTSHLMAISGLHVGLAATAAYLLAVTLLGLCCRGNHHRAALGAALSVATAYVAASGFAVPAQRALLMLVFATVAGLARREVHGFTVLALAMIVIILADPVASMAPGFRLSFAAVAILLWQARRSGDGKPSRWRRPLRALKTLVTLQFALLLGLLPLTAYEFGRVSLLAPLVNLLAIPLFTLVTVPCVLLSIALPGFPGDGTLQLAALSIRWLEYLLAVAAAAPLAAIEPAMAGSTALLLCLLSLSWLLPAGWPGRGIAWLAFVALLTWRPAKPADGCVVIRALDVGQGLAIVVETARRTLLYDTGPAWRSGGSAAERVLIPYLRYRGIDKIDRLVVSHGDLDHAGGLQALLANTRVGEVIAGESLPLPDVVQQRCSSELGWSWDGVQFSFLHPSPADPVSGNEASCVLLIAAGENRTLLTGDIESATEARLVRMRQLPPVGVVTVPHHGSRTSSIAPFVRALGPSFAIVSAGHANRWGFPKDDVVARWRAAGATVLNTADSGSISWQMCAAALHPPREWRKQKRRIWHDADS